MCSTKTATEMRRQVASTGTKDTTWSDLLDLADIEHSYSGVPVTSKRHLIESWSKVQFGVTLMLKHFKEEAKSFSTELLKAQSKIETLQGKLTAAQEEIHHLENDDRRGHVLEAVAKHGGSHALIADIEQQYER